MAVTEDEEARDPAFAARSGAIDTLSHGPAAGLSRRQSCPMPGPHDAPKWAEKGRKPRGMRLANRDDWPRVCTRARGREDGVRSGFQENFWAVLLALIAIVAFLERARHHPARRCEPRGRPEAARDGGPRLLVGAPQAAEAPFHNSSAKAIIERKPFDSADRFRLNAKALDLTDEDRELPGAPPDMSTR